VELCVTYLRTDTELHRGIHREHREFRIIKEEKYIEKTYIC
jgi:hypothetical protein